MTEQHITEQKTMHDNTQNTEVETTTKNTETETLNTKIRQLTVGQRETFKATQTIQASIDEQAELIAQMSRKLDNEPHSSNIDQLPALLDKMYAELSTYKRGEQIAWQRKLLQDVIDAYNVIEAVTPPDIGNKDNAEFQKITDALDAVKIMLLDTLERHQVYPMDDENYQNRKSIRVLDTQSTNNPDQDQKICQIYKQGFLHEDYILRRADVSVYRYTESTEQSEGDE